MSWKEMRNVARLAALALGLAGCARCDRPSDPAAHLVARSLNETTTLAMLEDGTVVVDTGVFVYRAGDDGALVRIGDLAGYKAFLPQDDGPPLPRQRARTFFGTKEQPKMLDGFEAYAFTDGTWRGAPAKVASTPTFPFRKPERRWDTSTATLPAETKGPAGHGPQYVRKYGDGTFIRMASPGYSLPAAPSPIVLRPHAREEVVVPIPDADARWSCVPAPSADGHAYVDCRAHDGPGEERRLYQLDERTWARVAIPSRDLEAPLVVAKDGAVWMGLAGPARVVARTRAGRIVTVPLADAPSSASRATYASAPSGPVTLGIPRGASSKILDTVFDLAPAPGGAIIVLAREHAPGAHVVFRIGGTDVLRPDVIGSEIDQLVEVRNVDPPKRWIGHCRQVFVEVPRGRDAGSLDLRPVTEGTFVSGRLHDRTVAGVVFNATESTLEPFEIAIGGFVDTWTTNPAAPPEVTCTVPVLDRVD